MPDRPLLCLLADSPARGEDDPVCCSEAAMDLVRGTTAAGEEAPPLQRLRIPLAVMVQGGHESDASPYSHFQILAPLARMAWPALRALELDGAPLTPSLARRLVSLQLPALEKLSIIGRGADGGGFQTTPDALAAAELLAQGAWPALKSLALRQRCIPLTADTLLVLGSDGGSRWPHLTELSFAGHSLGDRDPAWVGQVVQAMRAWPRLRRLELADCGVCDAGAAALAASGWDLRELDLAGNMLTADGAAALMLRAWPSLVALRLDRNPGLGDDGVSALGRLESPRLECLDLRGSETGHPGVAGLACGDWPVLRELELGTGSRGQLRDVRELLPEKLGHVYNIWTEHQDTWAADYWAAEHAQLQQEIHQILHEDYEQDLDALEQEAAVQQHHPSCY